MLLLANYNTRHWKSTTFLRPSVIHILIHVKSQSFSRSQIFFSRRWIYFTSEILFCNSG